MIISRSNCCPSCGVRSNSCYIVYDDGYKCFSCGVSSRKSEEYFAYRPRQLETAKKELYVPENTTNLNEFSPDVLQWLYSYYAYDDIIRDSRIAYCPSSEYKPESIILPVSFGEDGKIKEYQRRFFPKAFFSSSGVKKEIFIRGRGEKLVLVEDYISCLRVSKHYACLCLFGTSLSTYIASYIIQNYVDVVIWLDSDGPGINASGKIHKQLEEAYTKNMIKMPEIYPGDISLNQLKTSMSPKDYTDHEIKNIISSAGYCVSGVVNTINPYD